MHCARTGLIALLFSILVACKATPPSGLEKKLAQESKDMVIGGKDWPNPLPDDDTSRKEGAQQFAKHCGVCHGFDGRDTGVVFAQRMSPPVPKLTAPEIQKYTDGQLKWIIQNGIRMSGMPAWSGLLNDQQMWQLVHYIRHLPSAGRTGTEPGNRPHD